MCFLCVHIKKGEDHFDTLNAYFIFAQFLVILHLSKKGVTQKIRRGPDMGCLCLHIIKGEDHFYTLNAHFIFAKFRTVLHLSKRVVVVSFSKLIQYNAHNGEDCGRSERCLPVLTHKKGEGSFRHVQCPFHSCAKFNNFAPA